MTRSGVTPQNLSNCRLLKKSRDTVMNSNTTAFVFIDNQKAFEHPTYWGTSRSNAHYEENAKSLLEAFRAAHTRTPERVLIVHIFHASSSPESILNTKHPESGIKPLEFANPNEGEKVIWKSVNSAFIGTELSGYLCKKGVNQLVLAGLTTDHCVSTTTRMAANLQVHGHVILVSDATATFSKGGFDAETVHNVSVASLEGEFADILSTQQVIKELEEKF